MDRRRVALEGEDLLAGGHVPQPNGLVGAAGDELLAIGTEADTGDPVGMTLEIGHLLARSDVPDLHQTVGPGRRQALAVGTEADAQYLIGVAFQRPRQFAGSCLPHVNGPILARRRQPLAIGTEGNGPDGVLVPLEGMQHGGRLLRRGPAVRTQADQ